MSEILRARVANIRARNQVQGNQRLKVNPQSERLRLRLRKLQATQYNGKDRNCSPPTHAANNSGLTRFGQLPHKRYAKHIAQYVD